MINKYGEALHGLEAHSAHKEEAVSIRYEKVCRVMYVTLSSLKVFWINCTFKENYLKIPTATKQIEMIMRDTYNVK